MLETKPDAVLVVEDDEVIRSSVAQALAGEGYEVACAENGQEALERIVEQPIGLILLDMRLPVMDGWAFAKALVERGYATPLVVMSATRSQRTWAEEINAAGVLPKPFELVDLIAVVESFHLPQKTTNPQIDDPRHA